MSGSNQRNDQFTTGEGVTLTIRPRAAYAERVVEAYSGFMAAATSEPMDKLLTDIKLTNPELSADDILKLGEQQRAAESQRKMANMIAETMGRGGLFYELAAASVVGDEYDTAWVKENLTPGEAAKVADIAGELADVRTYLGNSLSFLTSVAPVDEETMKHLQKQSESGPVTSGASSETDGEQPLNAS